MSLRPSVDQQRITEFLRQLGEQSRAVGRIYLVGGSTDFEKKFRALEQKWRAAGGSL